MKRYNCTSSDKRGAFGLCMEEHKEGAFVPFSEISGLAEQLADATRQRGVMAGLLREVTKTVPAIGVAIDDLPVVDAFLERIEKALTGQELGHSSNDALAMMMDELHDICVGLDAPGGAQNGAEAWDQVKGARDRVLSSLNQGRPDTEWTDAATSPVAADYRELQEQHDQLQSKHKGALDLLQEAHEVMRRIIPTLPQDCANRSDLLDRIEVALAGKQQNKPVTITETIRTAPERIWLQVGDQSHYHSEPFPEHHDEVTWCSDSVVACEVPYVRADLAGDSELSLGVVNRSDACQCKEMSLDEAISHAIEKSNGYGGCAQQHSQLAIWLGHYQAMLEANHQGRIITEGQELELVTVLQSIVNGFSDDPAHDAAALLKRITGEVQWTGDSFQLPSRQGGEPCDSASPSSSPA